MPRVAPYHLSTLPRGWPRRVRSGAVHAISLAEFALTTALGWAAQSLNPRLRLRAKLERLRNEISLLREEVRIKDARIQQIDPQKRPHYPPTERLAILELPGGVTPQPTLLISACPPTHCANGRDRFSVTLSSDEIFSRDKGQLLQHDVPHLLDTT